MVAERVIVPLVAFVIVVDVADTDTANLACLCTKDSRCVLGELSPEFPIEPLLKFTFPFELLAVFPDDVFLAFVEGPVADNFVIEPLEDTDLSPDVEEVCDTFIEASIPPPELEVDDVMLLFMIATLEGGVFTL